MVSKDTWTSVNPSVLAINPHQSSGLCHRLAAKALLIPNLIRHTYSTAFASTPVA